MVNASYSVPSIENQNIPYIELGIFSFVLMMMVNNGGDYKMAFNPSGGRTREGDWTV